jgi:hypothetical protein
MHKLRPDRFRPLLPPAGVLSLAPTYDKKIEIIALTQWEQKKIDAIELYVEAYPSDQKSTNMLYEAAYILYSKNLFADSAPYFLSAITSDPGGEPATQAAILILDSLTLVEDWENLYTYSKAFYEQPDLGEDDFKNQVWEVHKEANRNLK